MGLGVGVSGKYNKQKVKINGMGWNFWQSFDWQFKKDGSFFIKPTAKYI